MVTIPCVRLRVSCEGDQQGSIFGCGFSCEGENVSPVKERDYKPSRSGSRAGMLEAAGRVEGGAPDIEELIIAAEPTQVPIATEPVATN